MRVQVRITPATQSETIYNGETGRPIGTIQRRRVLDKESPMWTAYDLDAEQICTADSGFDLRRRLRLHFLAKAREAERFERESETTEPETVEPESDGLREVVERAKPEPEAYRKDWMESASASPSEDITISIHPERLSDGSEVFTVRVNQHGVGSLALSAVNEDSAGILAHLLMLQLSAQTIHSVEVRG